MKSKIKSLLLLVGIDGPIFLAILGRGLSFVFGPVTMYLLVTRLTRAEQGYFYTFNNILGLSALFELGVSIAILQFASHEMALLYWASDGTADGNHAAKTRLASLLRLSLRWYGVIAALIIVIVLPVGMYLFSHDPKSANVRWLVPWFGSVLITLFACGLTPVWAVLEGSGLVKEICFVRLVQQVGGSLFLWIGLLMGMSLSAATLQAAFVLIWGVIWLGIKRRKWLIDLLTFNSDSPGLNWRLDFWPMQWRLGVATTASYLIYQAPGPILFHWHGAAAAGRWGFSYTLAAAASPVGFAWINTKIPQFGALIAKKEYAKLDALFFTALRQSTILVAVCGSAIWIGVVALNLLGSKYNDRLLTPLPFALLILNTITVHVAFSMGAYLRSHKKEPYLCLAIALASYMLGSVIVFGPKIDPGAMAAVVFAGDFFILLLCGTYIFTIKRQEWHNQGELTSILDSGSHVVYAPNREVKSLSNL